MKQFTALSFALLLVAGCGTNIGDPVAGRVTFAAARAACIGYAEGSKFDSGVSLHRANRDSGASEFVIVNAMPEFCQGRCSMTAGSLDLSIAECESRCRICNVQVIAAVFDE